MEREAFLELERMREELLGEFLPRPLLLLLLALQVQLQVQLQVLLLLLLVATRPPHQYFPTCVACNHGLLTWSNDSVGQDALLARRRDAPPFLKKHNRFELGCSETDILSEHPSAPWLASAQETAQNFSRCF